MGIYKFNYARIMLIVYLIFAVEHHQAMAVRTLEGELWMTNGLTNGLVFNSLPKGQIRSSKASPCTFIPRKGRGRCAMEINNDGAYVAHHHAIPTFPDLVGKFGVALGMIINQTQGKQSS